MEKDKYYLEACMDGYDLAHHGVHWTQETVEKRAEDLRELDRPKGFKATESTQ